MSGISTAIKGAECSKIYVCNVVTEPGETMGYAVADHLAALQRHTFPEIVDYVVANDDPNEAAPEIKGEFVAHDGRPLQHARLELRDLADPKHRARHDSKKLAEAIMDVYQGRRSDSVPLRSGGR